MGRTGDTHLLGFPQHVGRIILVMKTMHSQTRSLRLWTQTGDGYGDDANGSNPDAFTGEWSDDGDGIGNNADAFPFDPSNKRIAMVYEINIGFYSMEFDGDGYGDNAEGTNTMFITDPTQWVTDGDGYGDNPTGRLADAIADPTQWIDEDDDGLGDNQSGNNPDPFLFDFDNDGFVHSTHFLNLPALVIWIMTVS